MDAACCPAPAGVNHPAACFLIITLQTSFLQLVKQETFNSQDSPHVLTVALTFDQKQKTQFPLHYYSDKISNV